MRTPESKKENQMDLLIERHVERAFDCLKPPRRAEDVVAIVSKQMGLHRHFVQEAVASLCKKEFFFEHGNYLTRKDEKPPENMWDVKIMRIHDAVKDYPWGDAVKPMVENGELKGYDVRKEVFSNGSGYPANTTNQKEEYHEAVLDLIGMTEKAKEAIKTVRTVNPPPEDVKITKDFKGNVYIDSDFKGDIVVDGFKISGISDVMVMEKAANRIRKAGIMIADKWITDPFVAAQAQTDAILELMEQILDELIEGRD